MSISEMNQPHLHTTYQSLATAGDEDNVVIHQVDSVSRWNHVENLDDFFTRVYYYHQNSGFLCMVLKELFELFQFIFVIVFSTFLFQCVDYDILFANTVVNSTHKVAIDDVVLPASVCLANPSGFLVLCLVVASLFWFIRLIRVIYHISRYAEIRSFYLYALKISSYELSNMTWHEVQKRLRDIQAEQQMCIHKKDLTELDIYHRILRFKNYMVAMVNKKLLPPTITFFSKDFVFYSRGLKFNLEMLFFYSPWSPFANNWQLKSEYKSMQRRSELANDLSKKFLWCGVINFVFCPLIFLWQILYSFFSYADVIKREPGSLGGRKWSQYGRIYLRHFNELDHELSARLTRAYKPAQRYMDIFTSSLLAIVARNVAFFCGSLLAVLVVLTVYDEDVITVQHVLTAITVLGITVTVCRAFIPDENLVWCPETLLTATLAHIHYMPDSWKGSAHKIETKNQFSQLFQYKAVYILEELLSPIVTPFLLCFYLRGKSLEYIDFFRNFTVDVVGVGDVCSFAQMDVAKHGNKKWAAAPSSSLPSSTSSQQAEGGKTELSLMHFACTNPDWTPTEEKNQRYIHNIRHHPTQDIIHPTQQQPRNPLLGAINKVEGPISSTMLPSLQNNLHIENVLGSSTSAPEVYHLLDSSIILPTFQSNLEMNGMSQSALYMHDLHSKHTLITEVEQRQEEQARQLWRLPEDRTNNQVDGEEDDDDNSGHKPLLS